MENQEDHCYVFETPDGRVIGITAPDLQSARDRFVSYLDYKQILCWFDPELIEPEIY